jgi:putative DNA primase/helicase
VAEKRPFHVQVAETILAQLRRGTAPWLKPWAPGESRLPHNPVSGTRYRGANAVWLAAVAELQGYDDPRWLTYRQAESIGAQVRRGEKGTPVQYWKFEERVPVRDAQGEPVRDEAGASILRTVRLERPRVFHAVVFNAAQVKNLPEREHRAPQWDPHARAQAILTACGVRLHHDQADRSFYRIATDSIHLPGRDQFATAECYYATALHELAHASGHRSRLARDLAHPFGSEAYAKEELRAEIASMMLGDRLAIGHDPGQHAAYIESWIKVLQDDPLELFRAARDAERIMDYVLGLEQQTALAPARQPAVPEPSSIEGEPMRVASEKTLLVVPYAEKDEAKALGARWDRAVKSWYAPPGTDLNPLARWLPENVSDRAGPPPDPREGFAAALREAGLRLEGLPEMDGKLHRVPVEGGRRGRTDGAYIGYLNGHPAGFIQNHKTGVKRNWKAKGHMLTEAERARLRAQASRKRAEREAELAEQYERRARECEARWGELPEAAADHPYLQAKGVPSLGLRQNEQGALVMPLRDIGGKIWSLQWISPTHKGLEKDARVCGCFHLIDPKGDFGQGGDILVVEGYATGASVHQATGRPVVVAVNATNLAAVGTALRQAYPERAIVFLADDDRHLPPKLHNAGREKAEQAAREVGGHAVFPRFTATERGPDFTDWNDLHRARGLAAVRRQVEAELARVKLRAEERAARALAVSPVEQRRERETSLSR